MCGGRGRLSGYEDWKGSGNGCVSGLVERGGVVCMLGGG